MSPNTHLFLSRYQFQVPIPAAGESEWGWIRGALKVYPCEVAYCGSNQLAQKHKISQLAEHYVRETEVWLNPVRSLLIFVECSVFFVFCQLLLFFYLEFDILLSTLSCTLLYFSINISNVITVAGVCFASDICFMQCLSCKILYLFFFFSFIFLFFLFPILFFSFIFLFIFVSFSCCFLSLPSSFHSLFSFLFFFHILSSLSSDNDSFSHSIVLCNCNFCVCYFLCYFLPFFRIMDGKN